jgi:hypothetical protein
VLDVMKPPDRQVRFLILAVVVVVAVLGAALLWELGRRPDGPTAPGIAATTTTQPDWTGSAPPKAPPTTTTAKGAPQVLWTKTGSNVASGDTFRAPAKWHIEWRFDCRNFASLGGGNFKLSGQGDFDEVYVQRFAVRDNGTVRMTGGGRGHLVIESVCQRWTVTAYKP